MSSTKDAKTPDSLPELSCFDMLNILRLRFYVERENLWSCVTMAMKDEAGCLNWITLQVAEHQKYVSVATSIILHGVDHPSLIPMVKRTLFVYLLEVLSGEDSSSFLKLQSGRVLDQRAQQEKGCLAIKLVLEAGSTPKVAVAALLVESPPCPSTPHSVCSTQVTTSSGKSLTGDKLLAFQALVARRPEFGTMRRSEIDEAQKVYNRETCCCGFHFGQDNLPMSISTNNHLAGRNSHDFLSGTWFNEPRKSGHYTINSLIL
ncbi:uncharacterized protein EDB93DRAFT_1252317 [Suillus bovinus]|uniref:uncharacterized protein n=1 Tax=Suillus bovinus TaxID=48563 RepID=UPI001B87372E|nr:uncharacterized protein EDB93DRAFT_1252317 [Suillus bovinus]KAG2142256.1 hypothetical protein EDB93DRAFT_1252317 [Suillus bovinus]